MIVQDVCQISAKYRPQWWRCWFDRACLYAEQLNINQGCCWKISRSEFSEIKRWWRGDTNVWQMLYSRHQPPYNSMCEMRTGFIISDFRLSYFDIKIRSDTDLLETQFHLCTRVIYKLLVLLSILVHNIDFFYFLRYIRDGRRQLSRVWYKNTSCDFIRVSRATGERPGSIDRSIPWIGRGSVAARIDVAQAIPTYQYILAWSLDSSPYSLYSRYGDRLSVLWNMILLVWQ